MFLFCSNRVDAIPGVFIYFCRRHGAVIYIYSLRITKGRGICIILSAGGGGGVGGGGGARRSSAVRAFAYI